ncbi:pca operon transcription factor PcaQ [Primorskyibacter marinus]|uniref:pca operon transcription factor PcaQ n=1 Tax=Primorskyibacter marinus TaxID=1977320 RepID=UPI000E30686F|nr:pca operon transcription factor PcaQ [Primorskyibacter marinus]
MLDRRIKIRHLQCFVEICRERSMKSAAEKLNLTQPAISKTLKELEEILKVPLLTRSRAGVSLTRHGDVFLHFAEMSLASLQQAVAGVEDLAGQGRARLAVGALPSVAAGLMPAVAAQFTELSSGATLQIMDGPHGYLIDRLRRGDLDIVIGRLGPSDSMQNISFTQLYNEEVRFIVRAGHPLLAAPELPRLPEYQVIYPSQGSAIRPLVERFLISHGIGRIDKRLETVSGAFGRVFTRRSDAIWIISAGVVANEIADGHLVALPWDTSMMRGPVGLMRRPETAQSPQDQVFQIALRNAMDSLGLSG